ncbi:MAG: type V CRISPR-associated protein Cas4 [Oscillospiraceae bacterium]|nr:type V CRISPR-associated protein Cas4 [Oscillospiraceae bacterium]
MSENAIPISNLNDFVFCPASIYFHGLDADTEKLTYQSDDQLNGTAAHRSVDGGNYSTRAAVLQGIGVCSEEYDVTGKIDTFDLRTGILTERKRLIKTVSVMTSRMIRNGLNSTSISASSVIDYSTLSMKSTTAKGC